MSTWQSERPLVALVGRPNVGKSTLFNRLTGTRDALVADYFGLTRDRRYGGARLAERDVALVDTGGLTEARRERNDADDIFAAIAAQVECALEEADVAVLVADAGDGPTGLDADIAGQLRKRGIALLLAVNKIDAAPTAGEEFAALGLETVPVSAVHGRGVAALAKAVAARLPPGAAATEDLPEPRVHVAVVGRPNVGKSTLVNRLLGEQRQIVADQPGTTRDAIDIPWGDCLITDTAGVRRKGRVGEMVEKFSIVKTLAALDRAQVAILAVDGGEGIVEQDLHVLSYALEAGAGVLLAVNKWDALSAAERRAARISVQRRLAFAPWVPVRFVSALGGKGVSSLPATVERIHRSGSFAATTAQLNRVLAAALRDYPPPSVRSRPIKLRYAHKAGEHPPRIVLHGNQTEQLPASYLRYLSNRFRDGLDLCGVPVVVETRTTVNPFAARNTLSERQRKRRQRMIRHRRRVDAKR